MMITLNPYLIFNGNCEEAFRFYERIFQGEILYIGRYKDVPDANKNLFPLSVNEKIMHATLQINSKTTIMGCDRAEISTQSTTFSADNFYLYLSLDDEQETNKIFNELAIEGKILMPITQTFWSSHYGMLIDQFGITWKITYNSNKE